MPLIVAADGGREPRSFRTTDALAGRGSPKSESLPIAMWTRACDTSVIVPIVRAISPSSARR